MLRMAPRHSGRGKLNQSLIQRGQPHRRKAQGQLRRGLRGESDLSGVRGRPVSMRVGRCGARHLGTRKRIERPESRGAVGPKVTFLRAEPETRQTLLRCEVRTVQGLGSRSLRGTSVVAEANARSRVSPLSGAARGAAGGERERGGRASHRYKLLPYSLSRSSAGLGGVENTECVWNGSTSGGARSEASKRAIRKRSLTKGVAGQRSGRMATLRMMARRSARRWGCLSDRLDAGPHAGRARVARDRRLKLAIEGRTPRCVWTSQHACLVSGTHRTSRAVSQAPAQEGGGELHEARWPRVSSMVWRTQRTNASAPTFPRKLARARNAAMQRRVKRAMRNRSLTKGYAGQRSGRT